jgi:hypothetical protein
MGRLLGPAQLPPAPPELLAEVRELGESLEALGVLVRGETSDAIAHVCTLAELMAMAIAIGERFLVGPISPAAACQLGCRFLDLMQRIQISVALLDPEAPIYQAVADLCAPGVACQVYLACTAPPGDPARIVAAIRVEVAGERRTLERDEWEQLRRRGLPLPTWDVAIALRVSRRFRVGGPPS